MHSFRRASRVGSPRTFRTFKPLPLRDLGLRDAEDEQIFEAARLARAVVLTKNSDFVQLLEQRGSPPKVLWLTCGNTSDAALQQLFARHLGTALNLLAGGETLVEIGTP